MTKDQLAPPETEGPSRTAVVMMYLLAVAVFLVVLVTLGIYSPWQTIGPAAQPGPVSWPRDIRVDNPLGNDQGQPLQPGTTGRHGL